MAKSSSNADKRVARIAGVDKARRSSHAGHQAGLRILLDGIRQIRRGNLDQPVPAHMSGVVGEIAECLNDVRESNRHLTSEISRIVQEVGKEGRITERAEIQGTRGMWAAAIRSLNRLVDDLAWPTTEVARVIGAVATGDLTQRVTETEGRCLEGEFGRVAATVNTMVDQLSAFVAEVTRVAREVGIEGRLGGQARVEGVSGVWRDLTDSVNSMAGNLTAQVRDIVRVATAVANGDLTQQITVDVRGEILELKKTINTMVGQLLAFADEVTRVAREVGTEGRLGGQARVEGVSGVWRDLTDSVNTLAGNLTKQVRGIAKVVTAVANGDLEEKFVLQAAGEVATLADTINAMIDRLRIFADQVTQVAREVGTEGRLGGQAEVPDVSGVWRNLTNNVNFMAGNLTAQVRDIARVATAVATGDLTQQITVDVKGEIRELKDTFNTMVDQLSAFADEVTRVAWEVGTEGRLGGQARVGGVSGVWRDLTNNVNTLAGNLTTQVRAIAEVSTAVTRGDLDQSISVDARGEVAELKNNINQMIANLSLTTRRNAEQHWLKTNLAQFTGMMQGLRDVGAVARLIMSEITPLVVAQHGVFFLPDSPEHPSQLRLIASYAYSERKSAGNTLAIGEGLVGQAAFERKRIHVTEAPADHIRISSGLGQSAPTNIVVVPILFEDQVMAVFELASFRRFSDVNLLFLDQLSVSIGVVMNTMHANRRTEELLAQSQQQTGELQGQSSQLQDKQAQLERTNVELEEKARQLVAQNVEVEAKNTEVEATRLRLEAQAEELSLVSRYKSEFLAKMSHELRSPLNSLLILSELLAGNAERTLTAKQVEWARSITLAGNDLLTLINDVLDLSKIEAGKIDLNLSDIPVRSLLDSIAESLQPVAAQKHIDITVAVDPNAPRSIYTDVPRTQQILRNLAGNACKFTDEGSVTLRAALEPGGSADSARGLSPAPLLALSVSDTGIGIPPDQLALIFEAFQQADTGAARKYGGTGLGLSISRELARVLGGYLDADSTAGVGSTFTLYLPARDQSLARRQRDEIDLISGWSPVTSTQAPLTMRTSRDMAAGDHPRSAAEEPTGLAWEEGLSGCHILVVDDDARNVLALKSLLASQGADVLTADSADRALDLLSANREVELILMDIMMPEMDGYEAIRRIRGNPQTASLPIIAVTAKAMVGDRELSLRVGANGHLSKPIRPDELLATIRERLPR